MTQFVGSVARTNRLHDDDVQPTILGGPPLRRDRLQHNDNDHTVDPP